MNGDKEWDKVFKKKAKKRKRIKGQTFLRHRFHKVQFLEKSLI